MFKETSGTCLKYNFEGITHRIDIQVQEKTRYATAAELSCPVTKAGRQKCLVPDLWWGRED